MSTQIENSVQAGTSNKVAAYVNRQLEVAQRQVKSTDLIGGFLTMVVLSLSILLLAAIWDGWISPLSEAGRWCWLSILVVSCLGYAVFQIAPLFLKKINPDYAARMIEQSQNGFKNSLLNYVALRRRSEEVNPAVFQALTRQAAENLKTVPADATVDRSKLITLGFVLVGLTLFTVGYKFLSPKDPLQSFARVLIPSAKIGQPARVSISDISPGDVQVFFGDQVEVSAAIRGQHLPNDVFLVVSTDDGQLLNQRIPMEPDSLPNRYRVQLGKGSAGLQHSLDYRIEALDGVSPNFEITVQPNPTIAIETLTLFPPRYTKLPKQTQVGQGEINALEGTKIVAESIANMPIKEAFLDLLQVNEESNNDSLKPQFRTIESIPMNVDGLKAKASFWALLDKTRERSQASHYQLRFTSVDGDRNQRPNTYPIKVTPDLAPDIKILAPRDTQIEIPEDATLAIDFEANDLDFEISEVRFNLNHQGTLIAKEQLVSQPVKGLQRVKGRHLLQPRQLGLQAGDTAIFFLTAADNRTVPADENRADPNITRSENFTVSISKPSEKALQPANQNSADPSQKQPDKSGGQGNDQSNNSQNPTQKNDQQRDPAQDPNDPNQGKTESGDPSQGNKDNAESESGQPQNSPNGQSQDNPPDGNPEGENSQNNQSENTDQQNGGSGQEQDNSQEKGSQSQQEDSQSGSKSSDGSDQSSQSQSGSQNGNQGNNSSDNNQKQSNSDSMNSGSESQNNAGQSGNQNNSASSQNGNSSNQSNPSPNSSTGGSQNQGDTQNQNESQSSGEGTETRDENLSQGEQSKPLDKNATQGAQMRRLEELLKDQEKPEDQASRDPNNQQPDGEQSTGEQSKGEQSTGEQSTGEQSKGEQSKGEQFKGELSTGEQSKGEQSKGEQSKGEQSKGEQSKGEQSKGEQSKGEQSKGEQSKGEQSKGEQSKGEQSKGEQSKGEQSKGEQSKGEQSKGEQSKGEQSKGEQSKGEQSKGEQSKGEQSKGEQSKGEQSKGEQSKGEQSKGEQSKGEQSNGEQSKGEQSKGEQSKGEQSKGEQSKSEQSKGEQSNGEQSKGEQSKSEQSKGEQSKGEQSKSEQSKSEQSKGEQSNGEQSNGEQSKSEQSKSEQSNGEPSSKTQKDGNSSGGSLDSEVSEGEQGNGNPDENSDGQNLSNKRGNSSTGGKGGGETFDLERDKLNVDHAKKATDLILKRLNDQKYNPDPKVLEQMNWTQDDLNQFLSRWNEMKQAADKGDPLAKRRYDQLLRSLDFRPSSEKRTVRQSKADTSGLSQDSAVIQPPPEFAPDFNATLRDLNRND